jgi:hypothetical protein
MATSKRTSHEQKPDQAADFRGSYEPSSRTQPKARVGSADRSPLIPTDMQEAVKLTGQWRHDGHRYHLFINHAGPHIEILIALVENGISGGADDFPRDLVRWATRVARLGGDVDPNDRTRYHLYLKKDKAPIDSELACGTLQHTHAGKRVTLDLDFSRLSGSSKMLPKLESIGSSVAVRYGQTPNLFENHIGHPSISYDVRSALWFPLTTKQAARLPGFIFGARIQASADNYLRTGGSLQSFGYVDMIHAYFVTAQDSEITTTQRNQRLANAADALDALVLRAYHDALGLSAEQGGIDEFQVDFWRLATLESLDEDSITVAGHTKPRTLLEHTKHILDTPHAGVSMRHFVELLHLPRRVDGHYYALNLDLIDVDGSAADLKKLEELFRTVAEKLGKKVAQRLKRRIPAGALLGLATIRKQDDPAVNPLADNEPAEWEATYAIELAGLEISGSAGAGTSAINSTGVARNVYGQAWLPEQLTGPAMLFDASGSIFAGGVGKGLGLSYLRCHGSGRGIPLTPLQFNLSGFSGVFGALPGGSVSMSRFSGALHYLDGYMRDEDIEAPPEDRPFEVGPPGTTVLHFPINEGGLTAEAMVLLEVFAATELAILASRGVTMTIEGYADQPDLDFPNLILSRNRAISTFNYLKNILGDELPIPALEQPEPERVEIAKKKEALAKKQTHTIFIPKSDWVTIGAKGEPAHSEGDEKVKPEYNQEFRRVDLFVGGLVRLTLRRTDDGLGK